MTFPAALMVLLVFATGFATGIASLMLFLGWWVSRPDGRKDILDRIRTDFPIEWQAYISTTKPKENP